MTSAQKQRVINLSKNALYARRSGNIRKEQNIIDALNGYLSERNINLDAMTAIEQTRQHLAKTSIAAIMNGIV